MMKYLQRLGRSLMLPVAVLPAAAILLGFGYWIETATGSAGTVSTFLTNAGGALINNMGILFAIGVALGLSKDTNGSAALSGLVGWLVVTTMLGPDSVSGLLGMSVENVDAAFENIETQFIGILVGVLGGEIYNQFSSVRLPRALSFFSGRRLPPIITAMVALIVAVILLFVWPTLYGWLVSFGTWISELGSIGAGIYGFFNRLLIPTGLHHALNSVFWFDVIGINDIANFWSGTGELGVTGMYQAGFFPIMMFGLPAGAFAMYQQADADKKSQVGSLMLAAGFASFFTGVTEPLEFAFMFIAPVLFVIHAALTGVSMFIAATFDWILGFGFSAGFIDGILAYTTPLANQPYMLVVQGIVFALLYYLIFTWAIKAFDLKTPGRGAPVDETDSVVSDEAPSDSQESADSETDDEFKQQAHVIIDGLGGVDNIDTLTYCATRLRLTVNDPEKVNENRIKQANVPGVTTPGENGVHVVVGTEVEFVYNEIEKIKNLNE